MKYKGKTYIGTLVIFYEILKRGAHNNLFISYADAKDVFNRRLQKLPKIYHNIILRDMQTYQMLKKVGRASHMRFEFIAGDVEKKLHLTLID